MAKNALMIGVDPYPAPADDLHAAAKEARNWDRILRAEFGFDQVTLVTDTDATRERVLEELRKLFGAATGTDVIVVYFAVHGAKARGWDSDTDTNDESEHALIVYAGEDPVTSFQHAAVTPSDIARILKEKATPSTVHIALVIDCCFAERFDPSHRLHDAKPPVNPQVLFIPNAVPGVLTEPRTFNAIKALVADSAIADPIVLGASGFDEPAHEVGPDNDRKLLFSSKLENLVETSFSATTPTYAEAIAAINPLSDVQMAVIAGNRLLDGDDFAGGFVPVISNIRAATAITANAALANGALGNGALGNVARARPAASTLRTVTVAGSLQIRLLGLLTLVDLPAERLPYRNRLIAAVDNQAANASELHSAFIEVADRDMYQRPSVDPTDEYVRGGVKYSRWRLSRHRLTIANIADNGMPVVRSATFQRHVPSLPVVSPTLDPRMPRTEALAATPAANLFAAFFDLQCGDVNVDVRDLEGHRTHFRTRYTNVRTWGPDYTAISSMLTVPLANAYAVIVLENVATGRHTVIFVNSGATILFGNARELDINGPGSGEGPRTHFLIYYQLAPSEPADAGLPETVQVPINACTVTAWP